MPVTNKNPRSRDRRTDSSLLFSSLLFTLKTITTAQDESPIHNTTSPATTDIFDDGFLVDSVSFVERRSSQLLHFETSPVVPGRELQSAIRRRKKPAIPCQLHSYRRNSIRYVSFSCFRLDIEQPKRVPAQSLRKSARCSLDRPEIWRHLAGEIRRRHCPTNSQVIISSVILPSTSNTDFVDPPPAKIASPSYAPLAVLAPRPKAPPHGFCVPPLRPSTQTRPFTTISSRRSRRSTSRLPPRSSPPLPSWPNSPLPFPPNAPASTPF